jgi:ribosome-associated protein
VNSSQPKVDEREVERWVVTAARAADDKKAQDTVVLRVRDLLHVTDAFVITSAANTRLVKTIADEVERQVKEIGGPGPLRVEGLEESRWVLMDYGDFVVHVFLDEAREYYNLERLWSDAPLIEWQTAEASAVGES